MERDNRIKISALLRAGLCQKKIANQVGVDRKTVYNVKKRMDAEAGIERLPGSGRKRKIPTAEIKAVIEADPYTSMRSHAKDLDVSKNTVCRAVKKEGGQTLVLKKAFTLSWHPGKSSSSLPKAAERPEKGKGWKSHHLLR